MEINIPVRVEWIDAHSSLSAITISELLKEKPYLTESVGILIHEDKEKIILSFMNFGFNIDGEDLVKHYQVIPKGMVKKISKLVEVKNGRTRSVKKSVGRNRTDKKTKRK